MTCLDPAERSARGTVIAGEATGAAAQAPQTLFEESLRDFVFAEVWSRSGLDRRARFLVALAGAACSPGPVAMLDAFARGALASGELSLTELREAAVHLSVYAGWSRGAALDTAVSRAAVALGLAPADTAPLVPEPWDPADRLARGVQAFRDTMTFGGPPPVTPYYEAGILNFVFGEMWHRNGLDQRARRWITLVGVCESRAETPIKSHLHAAMASGNCTPAEIQEFVLQYAILGGWPMGSLIQGAALAMIKKFEAGLAWDG